MADWKMSERSKVHSSRVSCGVTIQDEGDGESRQDTSDRNLIPTNPTTLGALIQMPISAKPKDPTDSPTTPLAFVGSPGSRHTLYHCSHNWSINGKNQRTTDLTDSPSTTPASPSPLGSPARRSFHAQSQSTNGRAIRLNDSSANFTPSSAFGSPGRTSPYARNINQSVNGRSQKTSFGKSKSFNSKYGLQSYHMETLQSQLYNKMRRNGVDHQTVEERLQRLKDGYLTWGEQSRPDPPLPSSPQPLLTEPDQPAQTSTITLLNHKFAKLRRFKQSTRGQEIPLYSPQHYHRNVQSLPSAGHGSPGSSASGSPRLAPSSDSSYEFDERTTALLALQQEMMWSTNSSSRPTASEMSEVASNSIESESMGSPPPNWYSTVSESPTSSTSAQSRVDQHHDDAMKPHYGKLRPPKVDRQSNLGTFNQEASSRTSNKCAALLRDNTISGACTDLETLVSLFSAEKMDSMAETQLVSNIADPQKKKASKSIETAMAKLSFNLAPKLSSPKMKEFQGATWGSGLSSSSFGEHSQGGPLRGTEMPEAWRYDNGSDVESASNWEECSGDIYMGHPEVIDTSLRL
ncbi:unnamed protein product [Calypogeia fissa]